MLRGNTFDVTAGLAILRPLRDHERACVFSPSLCARTQLAPSPHSRPLCVHGMIRCSTADNVPSADCYEDDHDGEPQNTNYVDVVAAGESSDEFESDQEA